VTQRVIKILILILGWVTKCQGHILCKYDLENPFIILTVNKTQISKSACMIHFVYIKKDIIYF